MKSTTEKRYAFADILDISYTPDTLHRCYGCLLYTSYNNENSSIKEYWMNNYNGINYANNVLYGIDVYKRQLLHSLDHIRSDLSFTVYQ